MRRGTGVAVVTLFCTLLAGFLWLPPGSARLALELDPIGQVDLENDARFELVLRNAGNADMQVLFLTRAELVWEGGRAPLEALRMGHPHGIGEAEVWPLETKEPIAFDGQTEPARLDLDFTWLSERWSGASEWKHASWVVPVELRRTASR
jgi:hypothetical protein